MSEMTPETCGHGEYTLVTHARTSVLALELTVFGVKCVECGKQWDMGDMMTAPAALETDRKRWRQQRREHGWMKRILLDMDSVIWMPWVEGPWYATGDIDELAFFRALAKEKKP